MSKSGIAVFGLVLSALVTPAMAEDEGHVYLGLNATSYALDDDRTPIATRSPGHSPKVMGINLGYYFNNLWAMDVSLGTDVSNNIDMDQYAINGYRFFTDKAWRPFVSAGFSGINVDEALAFDDDTSQAQVGVGVSGDLTRNWELRARYEYLFELGDESYTDNALTLTLNWHFRKPEAVAQAEPVVAAAPAPEPEPEPVTREVVDKFELLVQFDFDKSDVRSVYRPQFDDIAQVLKENPDIDVTIEGHTCSIGTEEYNLGLSEQRAAAVREKFMQDYGISGDRIRAEGYGESQPIADNSTQAGREQNRRAIAVILRRRMVTE